MRIDEIIECLNGNTIVDDEIKYDIIFHLLNMKSMQFQIGETLVDQSKGHISSEAAIEKIRNILSKYYTR